MARSLYDVLGISTTASQAEIEAACLELGKRFHPENNLGDLAAYERFADIERAYATLHDPGKRYEYDSQLYASMARESQNLNTKQPNSFSLQQILRKYRSYAMWTLVLLSLVVGLAVLTKQTNSNKSAARESDIEAKCTVNGLGNLQCSFYNAGRTRQSACVYVYMMRYSDLDAASSDRVCSGLLEPSDVRERTALVRLFKIGDTRPYTPYEFCMEKGQFSTLTKTPTKWTEGCRDLSFNVVNDTKN